MEAHQPAFAPETAASLVLELEGWNRRVPVPPSGLVLGRSSECDLPLSDPTLSRRHCRIWHADDCWRVEDLGSSSGTFLDGRELRGPAVLSANTRIRLGAIEAHLELHPADGAVGEERQTRNAEMLLRAVEDLYGLQDLDEVLRTIVDRAIAVCSADRGALLLANEMGELEATVARDTSGNDLDAGIALTRSLPARALSSGKAVVLSDADAAEQDGETPESVYRDSLRSVVCAPMPGADKPIGVLYVDSHRPTDQFGPGELATFEALAVHGALAIERAQWRERREARQHDLRKRLETENADLRAQLGADAPIGQSPSMLAALDLLRRVAPTDATVCLAGETGTGKEVLARWVHRLSRRAQRPLVIIDCGSIPEALIESELFGHEKGAFTGATASSEGRFREADGGTVFLDEIAELPLLLQTRLLRVLQEHTIQPVGARGRVAVDVRIVCATHRNLEHLVAAGQFREDLYYRLGVVSVGVPPLRERGGDIALLARHFLARFSVRYGTGFSGFTREADEALLAHPWPGNVRELENRVQRAVLLARPPFVTKQDLGLGGAPTVAGPAEVELRWLELPVARAEATERFERAYLEELLKRTRGQAAEAIRASGISKQMFYRLLQKHGIDRREYLEAGQE